MFNFLKKDKKKTELGKDRINVPKDPFPTHDNYNERLIIDIRDEESIEALGFYKGSKTVAYDAKFLENMAPYKEGKIALLDERCVESIEANDLLVKEGFDSIYLSGGFYYLRDVLNIKPEKEA